MSASDDGTLHWGGPVEAAELPQEWVLRELTDADLDDDATVVDLLERHGVIDLPYFDPARIPQARHPHLGHLRSGSGSREPEPSGTVEDARWWLKTVRALAHTWGEASVGRDPAAPWITEGFLGVTNEQSAWAQFAVALNEGLRSYPVRVEVAASASGFTYGTPRVGLYSAACHQVFNFVVRGETARRCENETCGRMFVHQVGGAQHGQHRTRGLLRFCSPECARAETQRQYRRRQKAAKKEKDQR